jgi:hypothetical protein
MKQIIVNNDGFLWVVEIIIIHCKKTLKITTLWERKLMEINLF